jgi:fatty acid desaturase
MTEKEVDARELYSSSKYLKYGGIFATLVMLAGSGAFFWIDNPALAYTFAVCSLMFVGLAAVGHATMKAVERHLDKQ